MDFRPIITDDKTLFEKKVSESGYGGTETNFVDMFCWGNANGFYIAEKDGFLYLRGGEPEKKKVFYFPPHGSGDYKKALENIIENAESSGFDFHIVAVTERVKQRIEQTDLGFIFEENRNGFDYVYRRESLASLSGKKYHSKKNFVNRFKKNFPGYTVEEINSDNISDCIKLNEKWCDENELGLKNSCGDRCALKIACNNYEKLGLYGILIRVDGNAAAFTIGSETSDDTFVTHFEKALEIYPGAYQTVNFEFANRLSKYEFINREEDMGNEGLRKAKLSYHPELLVKYNAKLL